MTQETEAQVINMGVVEYNLSLAEASKMAEKYKPLLNADMDDKEQYALVQGAERDLKKTRLAVEKMRKDLKADALEYGRKVDSQAKEIVAPMIAVEKPLKELRVEFDMREEVAKREAARVEQERVDGIIDRITKIKNVAGTLMQSDIEQIAGTIAKLEAVQTSEFDEFAADAQTALAGALTSLAELLSMKNAQANADKLKVEQDKLRKEEEELQRAENEKVRHQQAEQQKIIDNQQSEIKKQQDELAAQQRKAQEDAIAAGQAKAEVKRKEDIAKREEENRIRQAELDEKHRIAQQERLAEIDGNLAHALLDTECFKSGKKISEFIATVKSGKIDNIKFYL